MNLRLLALIGLAVSRSTGFADWKPAKGPLMTRWAKDVAPDRVWPEYPRPQLVRSQWQNLNGLWQLQIAKPGEAPPIGKKLADQIAVSGLILSDFPMGTPPYPQNFPIRNRIISGISLGVLIVEGGQYSGSAITARLAAEHGREVFAVPGNITSKMSWGPNLLIKQGAKLVQDWNDVVTELKPEDRRWLANRLRKQMDLLDPNDPVTASAESASPSMNLMRDRKSTRLNSSHVSESRMPSSA